MNENLQGRKNPLRYGWQCETCSEFVASSFKDGLPVSRYWRQQKNPEVLAVFCCAACALIDYEENKNA